MFSQILQPAVGHVKVDHIQTAWIMDLLRAAVLTNQHALFENILNQQAISLSIWDVRTCFNVSKTSTTIVPTLLIHEEPSQQLSVSHFFQSLWKFWPLDGAKQLIWSSFELTINMRFRIWKIRSLLNSSIMRTRSSWFCLSSMLCWIEQLQQLMGFYCHVHY